MYISGFLLEPIEMFRLNLSAIYPSFQCLGNMAHRAKGLKNRSHVKNIALKTITTVMKTRFILGDLLVSLRGPSPPSPAFP